VGDEGGDLLADSHGILSGWRNYFFQLLNVRGVVDVGLMEVHAAELLVPDPGPFEDEGAITGW
jgi:hypothetical protein